MEGTLLGFIDRKFPDFIRYLIQIAAHNLWRLGDRRCLGQVIEPFLVTLSFSEVEVQGEVEGVVRGLEG
jgi:hypothetical protein